MPQPSLSAPMLVVVVDPDGIDIPVEGFAGGELRLHDDLPPWRLKDVVPSLAGHVDPGLTPLGTASDRHPFAGGARVPQGCLSRIVRTSPLMVAIDQGVNLKRLRALQREGRVQLVQAHTLEQNFKGVRQQGKVFRIGTSPLGGPDMIGGDNYYAVERIIGKHNLADVEHIYAAWLNKNAYFVTENVDDFINGVKREALEAALPGLLVRTTQELIDELAGQDPGVS